jgi:hypothetical protein
MSTIHAPTVVGPRSSRRRGLSSVEGRKLGFDVVLREGTAVTAQGRIDRVVVDRNGFWPKRVRDRLTWARPWVSSRSARASTSCGYPVLNVNVSLVVGAEVAVVVDTLSTTAQATELADAVRT